jgi:tetratricopeptide (TPR) repeat protein
MARPALPARALPAPAPKGLVKRGEVAAAGEIGRPARGASAIADRGELEAARAAADRGEVAAAERLAAKAIALFPGSAEPRCLLAQIHLALDRPREAAAEFQRALFLDRAFVAAHLGMAEALRRVGNRPEAARHARRALKLLRARPSEAIVAGLELTAAAAMRLAEQLSSEGRTR